MSVLDLERSLAPLMDQTAGAVRDLFVREPVAESIDRVARDSYQLYDEILPQVLAQVRPKALPVCAAGCAFCCVVPVFASAPEIFRLARHLKETGRADALLPALKARATAIGEMTRDDRARARLPCVLLDAAGNCSAYEARPLACRGYNSCDAGACKRKHDDGVADRPIPAEAMQYAVARTVSTGVMVGAQAAGLDPGPYELACGLAAALGTPDAEQRWLEGEDVLAAAETRMGRESRAQWRGAFQAATSRIK